MSLHQKNFDASTISFSSYVVVNIIVMLFAIPYWCLVEFSPYLFWVGMVGSIINTFGLVLCQIAQSIGPLGPVCALTALSSLLLVIIEAIKAHKWLTLFELLGLIFGTVGALVLVIPDVMIKICCFWNKNFH